MNEFEEIKEKLNEISEVVEKYPDNLKESVFQMLTKPLGFTAHTDVKKTIVKESENNQAGNTSANNSKKLNGKKKVTTVKMVDDRTLISKSSELKQFIEARNLKTDVKFITAVVYFLTTELDIKNVDDAYIMTCYKLCARKLGNIPSTVGNCINRNQYLTRNSEGFYEVTAFGDNLVTIDSVNK